MKNLITYPRHCKPAVALGAVRSRCLPWQRVPECTLGVKRRPAELRQRGRTRLSKAGGDLREVRQPMPLLGTLSRYQSRPAVSFIRGSAAPVCKLDRGTRPLRYIVASRSTEGQGQTVADVRYDSFAVGNDKSDTVARTVRMRAEIRQTRARLGGEWKPHTQEKGPVCGDSPGPLKGRRLGIRVSLWHLAATFSSDLSPKVAFSLPPKKALNPGSGGQFHPGLLGCFPMEAHKVLLV